MRTTLTSLYTHYSARLAAAAAAELDAMGADPVSDADDVMQEVWLHAAQLLALPEPEHAWSVLVGLLDQALAALEETRHRELPYETGRPGVRWMPPAPMEPLPTPVDLEYTDTATAA
ncbi:hypothetical protein [Streptomyces uncialis]|uniref:hypothetical protein n=1 Tax=Streptomyces uncialis TaxID=1048205 RepID=UPI003863A7A5|nr:hypothetical protein OG268_37025 [Streptomyces uncialis]